jgi:ribonucleoside-diphosphate reductase alpha chain
MNNFVSFNLGDSPFLKPLEQRILHRHQGSGWNGLVDRVVKLAEKAQAFRGDPSDEVFLDALRTALSAGKLLPNSPLLVSAGDDQQRLFACFAVDVRRPLDEALPLFRFIHDGMGGVGYALTGAEHDFASLIRLIDRDTVQHQAGRPRPASNAVTMPAGPALDEYLNLAGTLNVTNMNVALSDEFMSNSDSDAIGQLHRIARSIHATGQPGIIFSDRIARIAAVDEPTMAANVCGEAPLAVDESALLASLNLAAFCRLPAQGYARFDEQGFCDHVKIAVRFLDLMHDVHTHANAELRRNTEATRKIGVGIMGFAHALILSDMRYGDADSIAFAERVGELLMTTAQQESARLAQSDGTYPAWKPEHGPARRNASLAAIAGTATIALLAGTSCGVEPLFSQLWDQTIVGQRIRVLDPVVRLVLERHGIDADVAQAELLSGAEFADVVGPELAALIPCAIELDGAVHIQVQAALQKHIDGGITKTINCISDTSVDDIVGWLRLAHASSCMGLTIYRARSLEAQPMEGVGV